MRASRVVTVVIAVVLAAVGARQLQGQTPPEAPASIGDMIPLTALAADQHGLALWNNTDGVLEAMKTGHDTSWTTCSNSAPFYLATRDHSTLDAASSAGLRAAPVIDGLDGLTDALATNGFATTDVTLGWSAQSLGADIEGDDWLFDATTGVERRYYTGGLLTLSVGGEPLATAPMARTTFTITYNDLADCTDDTVALATDAALLENGAATSTELVQAVATALIDDLAGNGFSFAVASLTVTESAATASAFSESGRTGVFLEAASGSAAVSAPWSCELGIDEDDSTHDWTLVWSEDELPTNGPLQLKVVAVTHPDSDDASDGDPGEDEGADSTPGRVTLTVFDDSAPTTGVVVDVDFPAAKGEARGTVDLTIQPGNEYRVTVGHSGGTGRDYQLGVSHDGLLLGQTDLRYSTGRSQDWGIEAGENATVTLELATDAAVAAATVTSAHESSTMATSVFVTIIDPATREIVSGPTNVELAPGVPQSISVQNVGAARRLIAQVDPDGVFRIRRTDGDGKLYTRPCPARTALASATLSTVQTEIFTPICSGCHGGFNPRGGLNLQEGQSFSNLVNIQSSQTAMSRVVPGDPDASYIVHKLEGRAGIAGSRMPQGGPFLSDAFIALVRAWIQSGAEDN